VLIANMPTIVTDRKFFDIPSYPDIAKDYSHTFNAMKKLSFDIWVASHASQFGLHTKHKPGEAYHPEAFIDRKGYDVSLGDLETRYLKKMKEN
jgi:metallo-beta-lactamase class B